MSGQSHPNGVPAATWRVIIGCDSFLALRNVRNGDLGRRLPGLRVLVDPAQLPGSKLAAPPGVAVEALIDFDPHQETSLAAIMHDAYLTRKSRHDGWTLWNELRGSRHRALADRPLRRTASLAMAALRMGRGWLRGQWGAARRGREQCSAALRRHPLATDYRRRFEAWQPSVVAGFSPEGIREMLLLEAAAEAGLPTAVMVRSRDNLSSKIQHLPRANRYLVWSEPTRDFLLRIYPEVEPERIVVTGSPQFDRHQDPAFRLPRPEFFARMGLDPERPLVVYTMATPGLIPHEIDIAQHLADAAHAGRLARRAQLLVRGHPRMFGSNVRLLQREYPEARAYPPPIDLDFRSPGHEALVVRLILEDEPVHLATLAYQDVQVNVCGTMTIDAAILDKPTVNVYYDIPTKPFALSTRRHYERSDVRQMMAYRCSRLARSPEDCLRLINQYLEDPTLDAEGRKRAREQDCGPLDGGAGGRVAQALLDLTGAFNLDHARRAD